MEKFTVLTGVAAPLMTANIDTDQIIPKQFLKTIKRTGLAKGLFYDMRCDEAGKTRPEFVLNKTPWTKAQILVAGENFGCGSSREHAPWALLDFGIRCVIAPSFADIFYNNCFKNGILPVKLPAPQVSVLAQTAQAGQPVTVDLVTRTIKADGHTYPFLIESFRRECLLKGLDDIGLTEQHAAAIDAFEAKQKKQAPWLYR